MNMKRRVVLGIAALVTVALTAGIAFAAGRGSVRPQSAGAARVRMVAACEGMHDSPAMQRMHVLMPAASRERCEAMHGRMGAMSSHMGSGMMSGSGMRGGSWPGMMGGPRASHHLGSS